MRLTVGNRSFVTFGLVPIILGVVALGGYRTCTAICDGAVIILEEKVGTPCPPWITQREQKVQHERAGAEPRQAEAQRKRQAEQAEKKRQLAGAEHKRRQEQAEMQRRQAEEKRQRAEILSGKVDSLLKVVAATQREKKALQERAEAQHRQAEAERKRQAEAAEKERLLAEVHRKRQQKQAERQRRQAEDERKRAEILSGKVDRLLKVVTAAQREEKTQREKEVQQERAETKRRQAEAERKRQMDAALLEAVATAGSGTRYTRFFVLGGLVVVIVAVWYTTRSIRRPVGKVAGVLEVVADDVKKVDSALAVVNEAAEGDLTKEAEIEGDKALEELAATITEMLEEVSKRNRADDRFQAAMPDPLARGWSREPATCLVPVEKGGSRSEPGRKRTDRLGDGAGSEGNGRNV